MKTNPIICGFLFLVVVQIECFAQDKDFVARTHYTTAEGYYTLHSDTGYILCIHELAKAERSLGVTNAKIMELKTKAWTKLVLKQRAELFLYVVDTCMDTFFKLADARTYPPDRYMEMVNLKNEVSLYKKSITPVFEKLYSEDYTSYGIVYALFDLYKHNMKKSYLAASASSSDNIIADNIFADTLYSLFEYENSHYYALPFRTGPKGGHLFWFYSGHKIGSWYMAFKEKQRQKIAIESNGTGFFKHFDTKHVINPMGKLKKSDKWPQLVVQRSAIKLEPDTEYFIWFSSNPDYTLKETKSVPIYYALYTTDDPDKIQHEFFNNKENKKFIRPRDYQK